jgi:hypothetical protein
VKGSVSYNGYKLEEFVPQKTSVYISQNDLHVGEMTVHETLDFSARCQGIGTRYGQLELPCELPHWELFIIKLAHNLGQNFLCKISQCTIFSNSFGFHIGIDINIFHGSKGTDMLVELAKREREAGILPEKDVDVFMKVGWLGLIDELYLESI